MNIGKKKINNIIILILVIAIAIVGGIFLMELGGGKDDSLSLGTELEKIESELIESETLSTEDEGTELEGSESSETEPPTTSEIETEEQQADAPETEIKPGTGSTENNTTTKPGNTGNSGSTNNGDTSNNTGNSNAGNNGNNAESDKKPSNNQDVSTWVPTEDEHDISPYEQMVIDAGYGNVVDFGDGDYAVLTHSDGYVNGKHGFEILTEYLESIGLYSSNMSGGFIDSRYDWYMYIAKDVQELITEDDEGYWDY